MADAAPLRVMTYNIQGQAVLKRQRHLEGIGAVIRQLRPDLVGLQEVHRNTHAKRSGDQIAQLAEATGMELHFGASFPGWGGEYGNALLTRGRISSASVHPLPGGGEPRSVLQAQVELGGRSVAFFVTHLAAWFALSRKVRALQLQRLGEIMHGASAPFVLAGDFNASPAAPEMAAFLRNQGLRICGEHADRSHRLSRKRLDYMFADPGCRTIDSWVIRLGPSDHWPLVADLAWG